MAYEYQSVTNGIFSFTIPGENKTVKLFNGDTVIVEKQLNGTYLKMFKFVREIPTESTSTTKQKTKIEDKITSVVEAESIEPKVDLIDTTVKDEIVEIDEKEKKPVKRRGRRKKAE